MKLSKYELGKSTSDVDFLLKDVIKSVDFNYLLTAEKIEIIAHKFKNLKICFTTDEENDDLFDFLFELSEEFSMDEVDMYPIFVCSKYDEVTGNINKFLKRDFALEIAYINLLNTEY